MIWHYETCDICDRQQRLAWSVVDETWLRVMGSDHNKVVCLECFLRIADQKYIRIRKEDFTFLGWIGYYINGDVLISAKK